MVDESALGSVLGTSFVMTQRFCTGTLAGNKSPVCWKSQYAATRKRIDSKWVSVQRSLKHAPTTASWNVSFLTPVTPIRLQVPCRQEMSFPNGILRANSASLPHLTPCNWPVPLHQNPEIPLNYTRLYDTWKTRTSLHTTTGSRKLRVPSAPLYTSSIPPDQ